MMMICLTSAAGTDSSIGMPERYSGDVIGRDGELAMVREFLGAADGGCGVLLLDGEPGIGKTTIWSAALAMAAGRSFTVLSRRCGQPEATLSFSGLADLLEPVLDDVLPRLPPPQARALEIALLRANPGEAPMDQRAVLLGLLSTLRLLSASAPVLLAIDDVQWLDGATARAVTFALGRLESAPVGVLASLRTPYDGAVPLDLADGLPGAGLRRLPVGPLTLGAISRVLREQSGSTQSRSLARRIRDVPGEPALCPGTREGAPGVRA
jgi:hypothetical protein